MRIRLFPRTRFGWIRFWALVGGPPLLAAIVLLRGVPMPGASFDGPPPPLDEAQRETARRLRGLVTVLTERIGERNHRTPGSLGAAVEVLEVALGQWGGEVVQHGYQPSDQEFFNLELVLPGTSSGAGVLVVGAHYDTVPGCPGADDNTSGTAAVIELARLLRARRWRHELRLVLFVNEEPPFFQTEWMGSRVYAGELAEQEVDVVAMLSLESIGYYRSTPGSQRYPFPFSLLYPDTGDFIAFVGNLDSRSLVRRSIGAFRSAAAFPSEGLAAPGVIPGVDWSDHWSFWQEGWPAVMITDTAIFRNPTYHQRHDTADTLDYEAMSRIVHGLVSVIEELDRARTDPRAGSGSRTGARGR